MVGGWALASVVAIGALLAVLAGVMNGVFTLPMRFLGRWNWENVWSIFIFGSCLLLPIVLVSTLAPASWTLLMHAPVRAIVIALAAGFAWGFGAIMFGQSVSALGIALANTYVLAISSAFGSLLPMLFLTPEKMHESAGRTVLCGVAIGIAGFALCGRAGMLRERTNTGDAQRGDLVGKARPVAVGLMLAAGSGVLSAVFNIGFAMAHPIMDYGKANGLSEFCSANIIMMLLLGGGSISNLSFCAYLVIKNKSAGKFFQPGSARLYTLALLMALMWGGSVFVYGAAVPKLGAMGASIGWPVSLATGLLVANGVGFLMGEWRGAPRSSLRWMCGGIAILVVAILVLSKAG
jgi:L-rhamnose-H+ transport protein